MSTVLRTVIIYFLVLAAVRLMGKRELAQLSPFDFVVAIIIAELAALPMEKKDIPLWEVFIPLGVLVVLEIALSYLALKSKKARGLIYGFPTVVIAQGKIIDSNMRKLRYNTDDLLAQLRDKGIFDIADVEYAIIEVPGTLSVVPKAKKRPVTPEDLRLAPPEEELTIPLIVDGEVYQRNLDYIKQSENWVKENLSKYDLNINEVFLATFSHREGFRVISKKGEQLPSWLRHIHN